MNSNKKYINQIDKLKLVTITEPRVYIKWENTEDGRDSTECYERIVNRYVRYVNVNNPNMTVIRGDRFFDTLEELYNTAYAESKLKNK